MAISSEVVVGWIRSGGPVAVDRHGGQPSPDEDDGGGEGQVADRVAGTGDHAGEPGEERGAGDARGDRPAAAALPGVAAGDDEAGRGQAGEPDAAGGQVQRAVPGDGVGSIWSADGEALRRIGAKIPAATRLRP